MKTRKEIAQKLGMKGSTLNSLLNGSRGMSRAKAAGMETRTGIDRLAWLYPQDWDLLSSLEDWCGDEINRKGRGRI